jgi:cyclic pyranopterin phosphate synthase
MSKLTHLDDEGAARMVDTSGKEPTAREATAEAVIVLSAEAFAAVAEGSAPKGDVLAAARIAGIMAAKKTPELIPLCHQIALSKAEIAFEMQQDKNAIRIAATVKTVAETGVEMEALTAVTLAALTIYDMTKAIDKAAHIEAVRLLTKTGGKSGTYIAPPRPAPKRVSAARVGRVRPLVLMGEVIGPPRAEAAGKREAFRAFMVSHQLRATEWAKEASVPAAQIYAFLTGRALSLPHDTAEKLARAAHVRIEDLFK